MLMKLDYEYHKHEYEYKMTTFLGMTFELGA